MPWTFAHPLAILPIHRMARRRLGFMALVVGSISPDLGYYVLAFDTATLAHQWLGLLLVCLPSSWCVFLFLRWMRTRFVYLLPQLQRQALQAHIALPQTFSATQITWTSLAMLLGAATHVIWDAFTHASGFAVQYFSFLRESVGLGYVNVPVFHLLQHVSTLAGALLLSYAYWRWLKKLPHVVILEPRENDGWRNLLFVSTALTSLMLGTSLAFVLPGVINGDWPKEAFIFRLVVSTTSCFAVLWTLAALLIARARGADQAAD